MKDRIYHVLIVSMSVFFLVALAYGICAVFRDAYQADVRRLDELRFSCSELHGYWDPPDHACYSSPRKQK